MHLRRNFTKLRISAHNLAIETGRYTKPIQTPIEKRICFHCKEIESEFHFIFNCSLYQADRQLLYANLSSFLSIDITPSHELFHTLMTGMHGDLEVGRSMCNYVNSCHKIRSEKLSYMTETAILQRSKSTVTRSGRTSKRPVILDL